jgi:hypothetical protein
VKATLPARSERRGGAQAAHNGAYLLQSEKRQLTPKTLTTQTLNRALLARQLLLKRKRISVRDAIHAVGGLQSQEPKDPFVALWSRISAFKAKHLLEAAERREIIRGTFIRATIHTVTADDYIAFRILLQQVINRELTALRRVGGGFEGKDLEPAARALLAKGPLSAQQMGEALAPMFPKAQRAGLAVWLRTCIPLAMTLTNDRWGYSRPPRFSPAEKWLNRPLNANGSANDLVLRCLSAIGPASSSDVRTWSSLNGMKQALEELRPELITFKDEQGRELFDLPDAPRPRADTPAPVRFLPEYDNTFLSHADRARIILKQHNHHFLVAKNGRRPRAVLLDGFVRAGWSIARDRDTATIHVAVFEKLPKATIVELSEEAEAFARFMEPDASEIVVNLTS